MTTPTIVSGAVSTVTGLGKDEAWLRDWIMEQPTRLGLGELDVADDDAVAEGSFAATDEERCFSVDVQLGEMEAARGFGVLDNWARNRVRHPDKTHVAALVTEVIDDRYRTTLEALAEHLPLVVVELQVWRGESEAIVVPHVALSSGDVDLGSAPAAKAAEVMAKTADEAKDEESGAEARAEAEPERTEDQVEAAEGQVEAAGGQVDDNVTPEDKDDTGVADPWGLPQKEPEAVGSDSNGSDNRLLNEFGG